MTGKYKTKPQYIGTFTTVQTATLTAFMPSRRSEAVFIQYPDASWDVAVVSKVVGKSTTVVAIQS